MDKYTVFNADGTVNVVASVVSYREALDAWVHENEVQAEQLRFACKGVLIEAGSLKIPLSTLVGAVMARLKPNVTEWAEVQARVEKFVKSNTGAEGSTELYCASAGRGGGYYLNPLYTKTVEAPPPNESETVESSEDSENSE